MDTAFENFTSAETLPALVESYQDTEDAQGRRLDDHRVRKWSDTAMSQGIPRIAGSTPEPRKTG